MANSTRNMCLNKMHIIGIVSSEPEFKPTKFGCMATFTVTTTESWVSPTDGPRASSMTHNITVFAKHLLDEVRDNTREGSTVYIEGPLRNRKWTDIEGKDHWSIDVVLSGLTSRFVAVNTPPPTSDEVQTESEVEQGVESATQLPF